MRIHTVLALTFSFCGFVSHHCFGQSLNVDFGDGAGTPPASYAGAGSAGVWNNLDGPGGGVSEAVVGLDAAPTSVLVELVGGSGGGARTVDDPATVGDAERLMDDFTGGGTDATGGIEFTALENGVYEVILYAWTPGAPDILTGVEPDCDFEGAAAIGGPWPGQLVEGVTHLRHTTTVTDGTLRLCTAGGLTFEGALNGVQLVALQEPGVPAVSHWGMLVTGLLVLGAGSVVLRRGGHARGRDFRRVSP